MPFVPCAPDAQPTLAELRAMMLDRLTRRAGEEALQPGEVAAEEALILHLTKDEPVETELLEVEFGPSLAERLGALQFSGAAMVVAAMFIFLTRADGLPAMVGRAARALVA